MEGQEGLEPSTPCLRGRCSNQLSYWPILITKVRLLIRKAYARTRLEHLVLILLLGGERLGQAAELLARNATTLYQKKLYL